MCFTHTHRFCRPEGDCHGKQHQLTRRNRAVGALNVSDWVSFYSCDSQFLPTISVCHLFNKYLLNVYPVQPGENTRHQTEQIGSELTEDN